MDGATSRPHERLRISGRERREQRDEDAPDEQSPHTLAPGKCTSLDDERRIDARAAAPGKCTRDALAEPSLSPEDALRYAAWLSGPRIDRRADPGASDLEDAGALGGVFSFLSGPRGGQPLPADLARRLGDELGIDLSPVRIHSDDRAASAAEALHARAFTIGDDIYFAVGAYDPTSAAGIELIAHEVAHVAQQRRGNTTGARRVSRPDDAHEQSADEFARRVTTRERISEGADPASVVEFVRREGKRIGLPFLAELEDHFGTSFDFVQVFSGEAAELASRALAASAFVIHNILVLADPSPTRELMLHELTHVMQMGQRRAPRAFGPGSLRVSDPSGAAEQEATTGASHRTPAAHDEVHRAPPSPAATPGTPNNPGEKRFKFFADKFRAVPPMIDNERPGEDGTKYYRFTGHTNKAKYGKASDSPWLLRHYVNAINDAVDGGNADLGGKVTDATYGDDLGNVTKSNALGESYRVSRVGGETARTYVFTSDGAWDAVVDDNASAVRKAQDPHQQFKEYFAVVQKLKAKGRLAKFSVTYQGKVLDEKTARFEPKEADEYRHALEASLSDEYAKLGNKSWDVFYVQVMGGRGGEAVFKPEYNGIQGNIFEQLVQKTAKISLQDKRPIFRSDRLAAMGKNPRTGDNAAFIGGAIQIVIDAKAAAAGIDLDQARAYAAITDPDDPILGYYKGENAETAGKVYKAIAYAVPSKDIADKVDGQLNRLFPDDKVRQRFFVSPSPRKLREFLLKFNPTIALRSQDTQSSHLTFTSPPALVPGVSIKSANLDLDAPGGDKIKSGTIIMGLDLGGAFKADPIEKKISPDASGPGGGQVDNKFTEFKSKLDKLLGPVSIDAKLVDNGISASITLKKGAATIPQFDLDGATLTATYTDSGLTISGEVGLSHKSGKVSAKVKIRWAGGAWSFEGLGTVHAGLVEGLQEFTVGVSYDNGKTKLFCPQAGYEKKFGAITLGGNVYDLEYDVDKGSFSGTGNLSADLGMFGKASATATIQNNKLKAAELSYDSPQLTYPPNSKEPTFKGTIGGTVKYESGKFSGKVKGTAELVAPMLKKLGNPDGAGLTVDAEIGPDGGYSGTISTAKPIMFGKHFKIASLTATLAKDGSASAKFAVEVVKFKHLDEAKVECAIDSGGFRITKAQFSKNFGDPSTDRISGGISLAYAEGEGLKIGGHMAVEIRKGFVAKGDFTYDFKTEKLSAKLTTEDIDLIKMTPVEKTLFEISRKIPIVNVYGVGVYIDIGFDLKFKMDFNLKMRPTIALDEISLDTFDYESISATINLIGALVASLTGTPKAGLGIFVLSPDLLSGGGGVMVPITGKMELKPSGAFTLKYSPKGGVQGSAKLGLALTFGITGAVKPYAELSVLKDMYNPKWEGAPLASFTLLPPRDLLNISIDLGGDLSKPKDARPPDKDSAATAKEPVGDKIYKNDPKEGERDTPVEKPPPGTKVPGDPGKDSPAFSTDTLIGKLKGFAPVQAFEKILSTAAELWEKIKGAVGYIVKIVKSWFNGAVEMMENVMRGIAEKGVVRYLGDVVKEKVGDTAYNIIKPLFERFANVEDKMMAILDEPFPSSVGGAVDWIWGLLKKLFGIGWDSIGALVGAIKQIAGNLAGQMGNLLKFSVEGAKLGVKRHEYWVGAPYIDALQYHFFAATEYKIDLRGLGLHFTPSPVPNPMSAPGLILFEVFENYNVPHNGDPARDRWR